MSYQSHGSALGALNPALLTLRTGAGMKAAQAALSQVGITVPSSCASIPPIMEGISFPLEKAALAPGQLYVVVWPLLKKLTPSQAQQVNQYFLSRMDPPAASYPVRVTTPCDLAMRRAEACTCRDRKNPARWFLHRQDFGDSWGVQSCLRKTETRLARHWISLFHQLHGWAKLPYGYREINDEPFFIWTIALNSTPQKELYNVNGSVASGNLAAKPKQLPSVPLRMASTMPLVTYARNQIRDGLKRVGFTRVSDLPIVNMVVHVNRLNVPQLRIDGEVQRVADKLLLMAGATARTKDTDEKDWREVPIAWNAREYDRDKDYQSLVNAAVLQATAYVGAGTKAVWQSLGSAIIAGALISPGTERVVRGKFMQGGGRMKTMISASNLVLNSESIAAQIIEQADGLLQLPPESAYQMARAMRKEVQEGIRIIARGVGYQTDSFVPELEAGAVTAVTSIKAGLARALGRLSTSMTKLSPVLRKRWECSIYKKAKYEADTWPGRFRARIPAMQQAIATWNATRGGSTVAVQRYQEVLTHIAYIESQLALPWWKKDYGPLPGWGWGVVGATAFLGTAVVIRKRRKKKPRKNSSRRTSRRAASAP
jgi:hypothetical protein